MYLITAEKHQTQVAKPLTPAVRPQTQVARRLILENLIQAVRPSLQLSRVR